MQDIHVRDLQDRVTNLKKDRDTWRNFALGAQYRVRLLIGMMTIMLAVCLGLGIGSYFINKSVSNIDKAFDYQYQVAKAAKCRSVVITNWNLAIGHLVEVGSNAESGTALPAKVHADLEKANNDLKDMQDGILCPTPKPPE